MLRFCFHPIRCPPYRNNLHQRVFALFCEKNQNRNFGSEPLIESIARFRRPTAPSTRTPITPTSRVTSKATSRPSTSSYSSHSSPSTSRHKSHNDELEFYKQFIEADVEKYNTKFAKRTANANVNAHTNTHPRLAQHEQKNQYGKEKHNKKQIRSENRDSDSQEKEEVKFKEAPQYLAPRSQSALTQTTPKNRNRKRRAIPQSLSLVDQHSLREKENQNMKFKNSTSTTNNTNGTILTVNAYNKDIEGPLPSPQSVFPFLSLPSSSLSSSPSTSTPLSPQTGVPVPSSSFPSLSSLRFSSLPLSPSLCTHLSSAPLSLTHCSPAQAALIPLLMHGDNGILHSATGTGKTLMFLLPLLSALAEDGGEPYVRGQCRAIIVAPTRELCMQIGATLRVLTHNFKPSTYPVPMHETRLFAYAFTTSTEVTPLDTLKKLEGEGGERPTIIIGTPQRLRDVFYPGAPYTTKAFDNLSDPRRRLYLEEDFVPIPIHDDDKGTLTSSAASPHSIVEVRPLSRSHRVLPTQHWLPGTRPRRLESVQCPVSPLTRSWMQSVTHVLVDEIDACVDPLPRHASATMLKQRAKHPKPTLLFLATLCTHNTHFKLIGASATANKHTVEELRKNGYNRSRRVAIWRTDAIAKVKQRLEFPSGLSHRYILCPPLDSPRQCGALSIAAAVRERNVIVKQVQEMVDANPHAVADSGVRSAYKRNLLHAINTGVRLSSIHPSLTFVNQSLTMNDPVVDALRIKEQINTLRIAMREMEREDEEEEQEEQEKEGREREREIGNNEIKEIGVHRVVNDERKERKRKCNMLFVSEGTKIDVIRRELNRVGIHHVFMHEIMNEVPQGMSARDYLHSLLSSSSSSSSSPLSLPPPPPPLLVSTLSLMRGLDCPEILSRVFVCVQPHELTLHNYLHVAGRVARMGSSGEVVVLLRPYELFKLRQVTRLGCMPQQMLLTAERGTPREKRKKFDIGNGQHQEIESLIEEEEQFDEDEDASNGDESDTGSNIFQQ